MTLLKVSEATCAPLTTIKNIVDGHLPKCVRVLLEIEKLTNNEVTIELLLQYHNKKEKKEDQTKKKKIKFSKN
jgi:hypothetical protein